MMRVNFLRLNVNSFLLPFASIFIRTTSFFWARNAYTIPNMKTTQYIQMHLFKHNIITVDVSMVFVVVFAPRAFHRLI
jgi:hypothetical protein